MKLDHIAVVYAHIALGAAFLPAVASRFGVWNKTIGLKHFGNFLAYTAEVNSFMPASAIPFVAWTATVAESFPGIALILGI